MGCPVNNITLRGGPEIILEGVSYVRDSNVEVVSGSNLNN